MSRCVQAFDWRCMFSFIHRMMHSQDIESMIYLAKLLGLKRDRKALTGLACVCMLVFREIT